MPVKIPVRAMDDSDPLSTLTAPPVDESLADKEARITLEKEAKKVSDAIDDELDRQRVAEKKGPRPVKVLLLGEFSSTDTAQARLERTVQFFFVCVGQSESGKNCHVHAR